MKNSTYSCHFINNMIRSSECTSTVVRVGLVAFGLSGRVFHAPFIITHPSFELVAWFERGEKLEAEKFCTSNNYRRLNGLRVETERSAEALCNRGDIDLVVVCSPIEYHYEHAKTALAAGKHVLVEKAFCSTAAQAKELVALAAAAKLICVPYQNRRFDSDFMTLRDLIASGQLGEIVEYNGYYNRWSPKVRVGVWKDTVHGSGGNFRSLGSHMIDQAVALFGVPYKMWADIQCQREGGVLDDGS